MADDDLLSKYDIDEKKFIVIMVTKPKAPAAAPAPAAAAAAPAEAPKKEESKPAEEKKAEEKKPEAAAAKTEEPAAKKEEESGDKKPEDESTTTASGVASELASGLVLGSDYSKMVQNIMDMGYDKEQVRHLNLVQWLTIFHCELRIFDAHQTTGGDAQMSWVFT